MGPHSCRCLHLQVLTSGSLVAMADLSIPLSTPLPLVAPSPAALVLAALACAAANGATAAPVVTTAALGAGPGHAGGGPLLHQCQYQAPHLSAPLAPALPANAAASGATAVQAMLTAVLGAGVGHALDAK